MATLVLTTVGTLIGGPIGGALGAVIGQQVDRTLLFAPKRREGPRLTELAVQTSSYGTQMPKVFGRMRVAGCVIWSTDLIERRGRAGGGKGQPSVTTYSYSASLAVALSARAIMDVGRIWADGKLLRGAAGDWKATLGAFRLHRGGEDQPVDPLIASADGAAPAHRGVAYAVFEQLQLADFGNRIPSLTFEVIADAGDVAVGTIARGIGDGALVGDGPVDTLTGFAASGGSIGAAAGVLAQATGAWFVPDGGAMALRNVAAVPTAIAPVLVTRTRVAADQVPVAYTVAHHDPARDYQIGTQRADRVGTGWGEAGLELAAACSAERAKTLATAALLRAEAARETLRVAVDDAITLAPGAAVTLPGDARTWRVTRSTIETGGATLDLAAMAGSAGSVPADPGMVVGAPDVAIGRTEIAVFELPPIDGTIATAPRIFAAATGTGAAWRSAALDMSLDGGATWQAVGGTALPAVIGTLGSPLSAGSASLADEANAIEVIVAHEGSELAGADAAALDRGENLALIGDELIQFARAVPLDARRWRLSGLWRGRGASGAQAHAAGARFVLIERDALVALPSVVVGSTVTVAATGAGDGGTPAMATLQVTGRSVAPPPPVHLRSMVLDDGGARVTWIRRSRAGWAWPDGGDVPLAEERERYRVTASNAAGVRAAIVETAVFDLSAAECAAGAVRVTVCQIGTVAASADASIIIGE